LASGVVSSVTRIDLMAGKGRGTVLERASSGSGPYVWRHLTRSSADIVGHLALPLPLDDADAHPNSYLQRHPGSSRVSIRSTLDHPKYFPLPWLSYLTNNLGQSGVQRGPTSQRSLYQLSLQFQHIYHSTMGNSKAMIHVDTSQLNGRRWVRTFREVRCLILNV